MSVPFLTVPIEDRDPGLGFGCGSPPLDEFFKRHALENDRRGIGKTFVLRGSASEDPPVLGFYTLSMAEVSGSQLPRRLRGRLPRYPLPVALIGRLAVELRAQGRGLGERLLMDAFRRVLSLADMVGCFGVIVDAKDQRAATFYERYGFVLVGAEGVWPLRMFVPLATVRSAAGA